MTRKAHSCKRKKLIPSIALVSLGVLGAPLTTGANPHSLENLLINGSFELTSPEIPGTGELLAGSTDIIGWTVTGTSTANDVIDWLGPGGGGPEWLASDGSHIVDLDGRDSLNGGLFQTFTTTIGQAYAVSFDLSGNPGDAPTNGLPRVKQIRVAVDGMTHDYEFDSTGMTTTTLLWQALWFEFTATSTTATLSFTSLTPTPNSYGALLDNVRVTAVPEPPTLLLLTMGLAAAATKRRSKRRA